MVLSCAGEGYFGLEEGWGGVVFAPDEEVALFG